MTEKEYFGNMEKIVSKTTNKILEYRWYIGGCYVGTSSFKELIIQAKLRTMLSQNGFPSFDTLPRKEWRRIIDDRLSKRKEVKV